MVLTNTRHSGYILSAKHYAISYLRPFKTKVTFVHFAFHKAIKNGWAIKDVDGIKRS